MAHNPRILRENPEEHHHRRHPGDVAFADCGQCLRMQAHCRRKIPYQTFAKVMAEVEERNQRRNYEGRLFLPYRCGWCDQYHIVIAKSRAQLEWVEKLRRQWLNETRELSALRLRVLASREQGLEARANNPNLGPRPGVKGVFS